MYFQKKKLKVEMGKAEMDVCFQLSGFQLFP